MKKIIAIVLIVLLSIYFILSVSVVQQELDSINTDIVSFTAILSIVEIIIIYRILFNKP